MTIDANPATVWAETIVDALVQSGLTDVCVAPGSRSTALTLACAAHPGLRVWRHLDERSAGFFALGMALARQAPVALVCTSGTAAANFFPAVVEAKMSQVPLLLLTADRPPELRHSGANQTIDQVKVYGDQVLWSVDLPLPEQGRPVAIRNLQALAARALATANGLVKGPVHLNVPFRKPFEPADGHERVPAGNVPIIQRGTLAPAEAQLAAIAGVVADHPRGIIVCGPRCPGGEFPQAVAALSRQSGYPIFADPLSGVRFGPRPGATPVCGGYETFLARTPDWAPPDVVLRFGAMPMSTALNGYLERVAPRHHIHVRANGVWADADHRTTRFLQADEVVTCRRLAAQLPPREDRAWQAQVMATERETWQALAVALDGDCFDGAIVADVLGALPAGALLFMGNSLPIRHLDQFGRPTAEPVRAFANRGASGIDGNVSTALGLAAATGRPVVLVVGDVTFYHDLNGLLAVREHGLDLTVVLLNNGGGGIFRRLPVAGIEPPFTDLFLTPHGLDFAPAGAMYGLEYQMVEDRPGFRRAFAAAVADPAPRLIEMRTDSARDEARRREIIQTVLEDLERQSNKA